MTYIPFTWVEKVSKVGPTNLNHLELGLQAAALVGDNAATTVGALPKITSSLYSGGPPGSPTTGDLWYGLAVDTGNLATTNGTTWVFRYNGTSGSASKWEWVGGTPLMSLIATSEATASAADVDLATVGPSITLSRSGDYIYTWGFNASGTSSGGGNAIATIYINAGALSSLQTNVGAGSGLAFDASRILRDPDRTAGDVVKMKYQIANAISTNFFNRFLTVQPIRIA